LGTAREDGYVIPPRYWAWLGTRRAVNALLWIVAFAIGVHHLWIARDWLANTPDTPPPLQRPAAHGYGHTQIDFGGQWVMARMLVLGHGRELYHRQVQWQVVRDGFPETDETWVQREETILPPHRRTQAESPGDVGHDANNMMAWFMGVDPPEWKTVGGAAAAPLAAGPFGNPLATLAVNRAAADAVTPATVEKLQEPAIGGPLYPPIHAFIYYPIGLFDRPHDAYSVFQVVALGFGYLAALGISTLTRGQIWWSAASIGVLLFPGCRASFELGQNPTLSLCILVWGWVLASRGRDWAGGAVWGLFAFKPVWGMAFFLVPLLMRRWRFCLSMVGTGAALAALTLPVVGLQTWFDWLAVGSEAAAEYTTSRNWIHLSRDIQGLPRRFLHDFNVPESKRETTLAKAVAWGLWGAVFATTVAVYLLRADRRKPLGLGAAFLFLGAWLTCYRFMYYDVLLAAVPVAILLTEPWRFFRANPYEVKSAAPPDPLGSRLTAFVNSFPMTVIAGLYLVENVLLSLNVEATVGVGGWSREVASRGGTAIATPRLAADTSLNYPWDTGLLLLLWAWCAVRLMWEGERETTVPPASR
jgi:hypothetical protein